MYVVLLTVIFLYISASLANNNFLVNYYCSITKAKYSNNCYDWDNKIVYQKGCLCSSLNLLNLLRVHWNYYHVSIFYYAYKSDLIYIANFLFNFQMLNPSSKDITMATLQNFNTQSDRGDQPPKCDLRCKCCAVQMAFGLVCACNLTKESVGTQTDILVLNMTTEDYFKPKTTAFKLLQVRQLCILYFTRPLIKSISWT